MWILFAILPTFIAYRLIVRKNIIKSRTLLVSLAWFLGQYLSLLIVLLLSMIFANHAAGALSKAVHLYLLAASFAALYLYKKEKLKIPSFRQHFKSSNIPYQKILFLSLCFLFAGLFFKPHLIQTGSAIFTSPAYWDFNIHFPIIQNFVHGDNFPPQNESYAGLPMTYHYYFDLLIADYAALNLSLAGAINTVSILMFFFMLAAIIGFCEEFFKSSAIGWLAVLFTLTSSSLHFASFLSDKLALPPFEILKSIVTNTAPPYYFGLIPGNPAGYNGNMFNAYYFLAERQMIFGILFLIFAITVILYRKKLSTILLFVLGCLMGQFFEGHLFIVITTGASLGFLLLFDKDRKSTLALLAGFTLVFLLHSLSLKDLMSPDSFYAEINNFPAFNPNFPTMPVDYPLSLRNAINYYLYAYGFKLFFLAAGLVFIFKKNKRLFLSIVSVILPTFIMISTIQLSPLSIYDNHKWLVPMNILVNISAAFAVYLIFFRQQKVIFNSIGLFFILLLTFSGFMELMPFLNSRPTSAYAHYPSRMISDIRAQTPPKSVFMSYFSKEIHLAGRKLYLGFSIDEPGATSFLLAGAFNIEKRLTEMSRIYSASQKDQFCSRAVKAGIDYVAVHPRTPNSLTVLSESFPGFQTVSEKGEKVTFLDINQGCR